MPGKKSRGARKRRPRGPRFDMSISAFNLLSGWQPGGRMARCKCGAKACSSYVGPTIRSSDVDIRRRASDGQARGTRIVLCCQRCGAQRTVRLAGHWHTFLLLAFSIGRGMASGGQSGSPRSSAPGAAVQGPSTARPSRRDPEAPAITTDEMISLVLAVRRAETWEQVIDAMGGSS